MSNLKNVFGGMDARRKAALDAKSGKLGAIEKIFDDIEKNPMVAEFLSDLHNLNISSNNALKFTQTRQGETFDKAGLEVTFGVSKLLTQYNNDKRDDGVLTIRFLPDSKMEIVTYPDTGRINFDAEPQPVSREALTEALSVYIEKNCRPHLLLGIRRTLGL